MIIPKSHIAAMQGFALADLSAPPGTRVVSLAQNESAFPPSPAAIEAARASFCNAQLYPDPDWADLRRAIAERHHVDSDWLLCSAGSMDLISALIMSFAGPGDHVLSTAHGYGYFAASAAFVGAVYDAAPEADLTVDVDALLAAILPETRLVCVANPGNPTGTRIPRSEIMRLREGMPEGVILLIDEAYAEFTDHLGEQMFDLVDRGDTVVTRSFSKAHALAGMRVGWGVFPPGIREHARKLLTAGGVTVGSLAAAAASMRDPQHVAETVRKTSEIRDVFITDVNALGIKCAPSHTNFVLLQFADVAERESADAALRQRGFILRPMGGYALPHCLRATIATSDVMEEAASILSGWRASHG
ncbi:MAG: histidinol-phosphate transaminase [Pseudomonadota bacterium]